MKIFEYLVYTIFILLILLVIYFAEDSNKACKKSGGIMLRGTWAIECVHIKKSQ